MTVQPRARRQIFHSRRQRGEDRPRCRACPRVRQEKEPTVWPSRTAFGRLPAGLRMARGAGATLPCPCGCCGPQGHACPGKGATLMAAGSSRMPGDRAGRHRQEPDARPAGMLPSGRSLRSTARGGGLGAAFLHASARHAAAAGRRQTGRSRPRSMPRGLTGCPLLAVRCGCSRRMMADPPSMTG